MGHYFDEKQDSKIRITEIETKLLGNDLKFLSGSGVFSIGKVDKGSTLLIKKAEVKGDILDLGCGYGAVGISLAKSDPDLNITLTDINERAIFLARKNAKINNVRVKIKQSDGFEKIEGKFDVILLNPPQSAGKKLCLDLMIKAKEFLKKEGSLQVVMRHKIGGKDLSEKAKEFFGAMDVIAIKSGYRIYKFS